MAFDFSTYAAVFLDLDGTLYRDLHPLPGASQLVSHLQRLNKKYACLTNSGASPRQLVARLAKMNIPVDEPHIYSCVVAAADYVMQHYGPTPRIFNLGTDGFHDLLDGRVTWVESPTEACDLVAAAAPGNTYNTPHRQWTALQLLKHGAALIGLCPDRLYPSPRGLEFGAGAMTEMLAYAASVKPTYCGKPDPLFFHELCTRLSVDPKHCLLIGDNLESDIAGAKAVGMTTLLTLTGITRPEDVPRAAHPPDYTVPDLTALF